MNGQLQMYFIVRKLHLKIVHVSNARLTCINWTDVHSVRLQPDIDVNVASVDVM